MNITLDEYRTFFQRSFNHFFRGCTVRDRDVFVFILEPQLTDEQVQEEEDGGYSTQLRPKGVVTFIRDEKPGGQWSGKFFNEWHAILSGAASKPKNQSVNIESLSLYPSMDHRSYVTGSGPAYEDLPLRPFSKNPDERASGAFIRGAVTRLRAIDGFLYVSGGDRSFGKRLDKGRWQSFTQDIPYPVDEGIPNGHAGFDDFDGFNENDIYAVGGYGDVWHYDGKAWRRVAFPSNERLQSVCCGKDGNVYISGSEGVTFMGSGDRWRKIHAGGISQGFRDMVWYEDKVWCTSDYGLWTIENGKVSMADVPPEVNACAGYLSVGDGVLLLAGLNGAVFRQGGDWQIVVFFPAMERLLKLDDEAGPR